MNAEPLVGDRATQRPLLFLHVGLPKTGTTQLQSVLWANRRRLHKRGVLYPGRRNPAHWLAARDLLGSNAPDVQGAWEELVEEVTTASAPVSVVSHEMFAGLRDRKINRLMGDFEGFEVHMVLSLRDFSRVVAATWQERAKNREVEPWPDYLRAVTAGPEGKHGFWRLQNAPQILEAWAKVIPAERIHVVTVPPLSADRLLLLKRFTQVLDIDADRLTIPSEEANQSLGAVEIALLQRVNVATADLDMDAYRRWVKRYFAQTLLAKRPGQLRVVLPESLRPWVEDETRRIRDTVERLGCSVVGSLDDLDPTAIGAGDDARLTSEPERVSTDDVLGASVEVIAELLEEVRDRQSPIPAAARALAQQAPATVDGPAARVKALARRLRRKD
jgi:hypothetical protein